MAATEAVVKLAAEVANQGQWGNMGCCDIGGRLDELFRDGGDDGGAIGDDDLQLSTARSASHTAV